MKEEIWYKARGGTWLKNIEPVIVIAETKSSVTIKGQRGMSRKRGSYENYFKTWDEAKGFLITEANIGVENAKKALQSAISYLEEIEAFKPPGPQERS